MNLFSKIQDGSVGLMAFEKQVQKYQLELNELKSRSDTYGPDLFADRIDTLERSIKFTNLFIENFERIK